MMPDKKIASIKVSSLGKRMNDKSFAKGVNRENIVKCTELGLELDEFFRIGLDSMAKVGGQLGL